MRLTNREIALASIAALLLAAITPVLLTVSGILGAAFTLHADCTATTGAIISAGKFNNCMTGVQTGINAIDNSRVATGAAIVGSKLDLTSGTGRILMSPAAFSGVPGTTGSVFNAAAVTFTDNDTAASGTATAFVAYALQQPTLAAGNTSVTTTAAATWYIANSPAAGTNETLTNAYAIWVDAGNVRFDDNILWLSGTSFVGTFDHAITAARTWTFPDVTGTVVLREGTETLSGAKTFSAAAVFNGAVTLGDAAADNITVNGTVTSNLIFTDNSYDIGASGATRPRDLFLAGRAVIGGVLDVTGLTTLTADLAVNGGDLTSTATTFNLLNATVTTLNLGGAATTVSIGAATGTTTINNATTAITGSITVNGTVFDGAFTSTAADNTTSIGRNINLGRNSNASTPAAGHVKMVDASGNVWAVWPDDTGVLRILEGNPTNANDTAGTVVGTQTSWHAAKDVLGPTQVSPATALAALTALPIYDFRFKQPSFRGPQGESPVFTGVVGYQRSDWFLMNVGPGQNPALNEVTLFGYTVQAIKELERRIALLEARSL